MDSFAGKVILVTGGATGIGKATARAFVREGASVLITGLDAAQGQAARAELDTGPGHILFYPADARDAEQTHRAFAECERRFGGIDILFNNAGVNCVGAIEDLSEQAWDTCVDTNLKGAFLASRLAIPRMRARGGGVIINNASNAGLAARAGDPVYCTSKAGLVMFTRALALAHARDRIRVNAVCPGPVTDTILMQDYIAAAPDPQARAQEVMAAAPMAAAWGRLISPEEVAAAVLYLCSDAAAMITGAIVPIDGGKSAGISQ